MADKTTVPAWHDKPTCDGGWIGVNMRESCSYYTIIDGQHPSLCAIIDWYGPIPDRPKPPEPMALLRRFRCVHGDERCRGVGVRINGTDYFWWEDTPEAPNPDQCPAGNDLEVEYTEWIDPEPTP